MHRKRLRNAFGRWPRGESKAEAEIVQDDAGSMEGTAWLLPLTRSLGSRAKPTAHGVR